jgi:O-acetyl-ADP-ribose deacetylase (regulator of RNase III)
MEGKIGILQGDITKLAVDLIVDAASDVGDVSGVMSEAFYRENLDRAVANNCKTIAFPAMGCERLALQTVGDFLQYDAGGATIDGVSFVCVSDETYDAFVEAFGALVYV